jgi:hypothetical protein
MMRAFPFSVSRTFAVLAVAVLGAASAVAAGLPTAPARAPITGAMAPMLDDGSASMQSARMAGERAPAVLRTVAVMADFADTCFYGREHLYDGMPTSTQSDFYYAAHDSLYYAHLLQDVADYYDAASDGQFSLEVAVAGHVPLLDQGMAYYGNHPDHGEQPVRLAADVIAALDPHVDFSAYDTVLLIHPGAGEETDVLDDSPEQIYSTYLGPEDFRDAVDDSVLTTPYIPSDDFPEGEGIVHVLILPENEFQDAFEGFAGYYGSLGVYCFEVGLRLGMLSLTDFTPSGAPDSQGIGQFGLMGYGLFSAGGFVPPLPCAFNRVLMGWLDPFDADPQAAATWTLRPSAAAAGPQAAARVDLTGAEYYLLEYRLQDPDGNRIFSFTGDLNGNNVPDFYDADSVFGDGTPSGFFDRETDTRERFTGAEWDFFLSDNTAREPGVKGAGSGVYIWHIDENVIAESYGARRNLFNANPARKSVDLEEADGIQDLDTRQPSPWWLGGDDDSFRGEDQAAFGPDTRPDTRTNGGLATGLLIESISQVVLDSTHVFDEGAPEQYEGILYADTMTFTLSRAASDPGRPQRLAMRELPQVDLAGSHLLAVALDPADERIALVAAADSGRIYAFDADLAAWADQDGNPATIEPLATATTADGDPADFRLPVAAGQLIDGGALEIVVAASDGLYAFAADGQPVASDGGARGRVASLEDCRVPVVLLAAPDNGDQGQASTAPVVACVVESRAGGDRLRFLAADGSDVAAPVDLPGRATASPVRVEDMLYLPVSVDDGAGALVACSWQGDAAGLEWTEFLPVTPGPWPVAVSEVPSASMTAVVVDTAGRGHAVELDDDLRVLFPAASWPEDLVVAAPPGGRGTLLTADGLLGRADVTGQWLLGWPRRPLPAAAPTVAQPLHLGATLPGGKTSPVMPDPADDALVFATGDGRVFLADEGGHIQDGWPIPGPASPAGTPALSRLGDGRYLLALAGAQERIVGVDSDDEQLVTRPVASLQTWLVDLPGGAEPDAMAAAAMYGGGPWRTGWSPADGSVRTDPAHDASFAASVVCYPQPATSGALHVRGDAFAGSTGDGTVVIRILDLQGEVVRAVEQPLPAGLTAFDVPVDIAGVASGMYLCMVEVRGAYATATAVRTIAVAR